MWAGLIATPPALAWYVAAGQNFVSSWHASPASVWPSIFSGMAVLCFLVMLVANAVAHSRWERLSNRQTTAQSAATIANPAPFRDVDEFYRTYDNRLLTETEGLIRTESDKYDPSQREKFLIRLLASVVTIASFERTWLTIFRSQLNALHDLNIRIRTHDELRRHYEEAAKVYPQIYVEGSSFEMWLGFLKTSVLVREYGPTQIEITVRGVEFLKYLVEKHYDESTRVG
jgi:hypothetical protein